MPGELDASAVTGAPPGMGVRLSSNEGPLGPAPGAVAAVRGLAGDLHRYPDDQSEALRGALAEHEGVEPDQVAVGTGSAALLMDLVAHECAGRGRASVLAFERAFVVYRLAAANAGAAYREVPTEGPPSVPGRGGYGRDAGALRKAIEDHTRVIMVDNPANPTGAHLSASDLQQLLDAVPDSVTVVIDEAYHQFALDSSGYRSVREIGSEHPRLLVVRTFSKAYALAGLRVGYLVGPPELVASLDRWRVRFNVNAAAQAAALAALADDAHLEATVETVIEGRRRMAEALTELGIPVTAGLGNFVTIELGQPATPVLRAYADRGVGVRPLAPYGMDEQLRVTVGTPREIDAFLAASREVLTGVAARA